MSNTIYENLECKIYKYTSPSDKVYIGQTTNIKRRVNDYKNFRCKNQTHLYNSFIKYGFENHKLEILEEWNIKLLNAKVTLLNERERYWQDYYDVLGENGLNCRLTTTNDKSGKMCESTKELLRVVNTGKRHTDNAKEKNRISHIGKLHNSETRKKQSMSHKGLLLGTGKLIHQYNMEGELIREATIDILQIEGFTKSNISRCCLGKMKTHKGFIWKYKDDNIYQFSKLKNTLIGSGRIIIQYTLEGILIKESTVNFFKEMGFNCSHIYNCCKGNRKTHKGFIWKYK